MKPFITIIISLVYLFTLNGCVEQTTWGDKPFVEMTQSTLNLSEHKELCTREPSSFLCVNSESIGDVQPTKEYTLEVLRVMNQNFTYTNNDTWFYNDTIHEDLSGDCEDIASTMAKHMIEDGIGKEYLYLVYRKISETEAHIFLAVDTEDAGLLHLDYTNSGYPIEPQINFHLPLDNVGVYKWVKGNI